MIKNQKIIKINYLNENAQEKINNFIKNNFDFSNPEIRKKFLLLTAGNVIGSGAGTALGLQLADVDFNDFIEHPIDTSLQNPVIPIASYAGKTTGMLIAGAPYMKDFYNTKIKKS